MTSPSCAQLSAWASAVRASDREAYGALYDALHDPLFRYAWTLLRDDEAAYDVLQDVFTRLWIDRHRIDPARSVKAMLFRMVRNDCFKVMRRHKFEARDAPDKMEPSSVPTFDADLDAASLEERLHEWVEAMPERRREVFQLSRLGGLSHEEIGATLGISTKTVNNHLVSALRDLRARMARAGLDQRPR